MNQTPCFLITPHLLSDLCLSHSGAPLFQSLLNRSQASLDIRHPRAQPVNRTAPLYRLSHLMEQSGKILSARPTWMLNLLFCYKHLLINRLLIS